MERKKKQGGGAMMGHIRRGDNEICGGQIMGKIGDWWTRLWDRIAPKETEVDGCPKPVFMEDGSLNPELEEAFRTTPEQMRRQRRLRVNPRAGWKWIMAQKKK